MICTPHQILFRWSNPGEWELGNVEYTGEQRNE